VDEPVAVRCRHSGTLAKPRRKSQRQVAQDAGKRLAGQRRLLGQRSAALQAEQAVAAPGVRAIVLE
jgi:hypothetical protein